MGVHMRSFSYIFRRGAVLLAAVGSLVGSSGHAASAMTHEITLKKSSDCDAALTQYVNHGQVVKKTYKTKHVGNRMMSANEGKRSVDFALGDTQP